MNYSSLLIRYAELSQSAVWFAAYWLMQSSVLILAGLMAAKLFRHKGAALQSVVYRVTLFALLICPAVAIMLQYFGSPEIAVTVPMRKVFYESSGFETAPEFNSKEQIQKTNDQTNIYENKLATAISQALSAEPRNDSDKSLTAKTDISPANMYVFSSLTTLEMIVSGLTAAWLAIFSVLAIRLLAAWRTTAHLKRTAIPSDEEIARNCRKLADNMGLRTPEVLRSPFASSPMLIGIGRPVILLPEEETDHVRCQEVFLHELAHLARHDGLWTLLGRVCMAIFFFQPLLWILMRRLTASAEEVCDDYVLHYGFDRPGYAQRLLEIAEQYQPLQAVGVGVVSMRSLIGRRIERILDTSRKLSVRLGRGAMVTVAIVAVVATLLTGMITLAQEQDIQLSENTGRVVDSQGRGIANATLTSKEPEWRAETDKDGYFTPLKVEPQVLRMSIDVSADGFLNRNCSIEFKTEDGFDCHPTWKFDLQRPCKVSGRILGPDGKPVPNAILVIHSLVTFKYPIDEALSDSEWTASDNNGNFIINNVHPGKHIVYYPGSKYEQIKTSEKQTIPIKNITGLVEFDLNDAQEKNNLVIDLSKSICKIEGRVIGTNNQPQPGAKVKIAMEIKVHSGNANSFSCSTTANIAEVQSDAKGNYQISNLPIGQYLLRAYLRDVDKNPNEQVSLNALGQTIEKDLHVSEEMKSEENHIPTPTDNNNHKVDSVIKGRVIDTDGRGIPNATLTSENTTWKDVTDKDGNFALPKLETGKYINFIISAEKFLTRNNLYFEHIAPGRYWSNDFTFQLQRPGSISGQLLGPDGKPLAKALLSLDENIYFLHPELKTAFANNCQVTTDNDGKFTMENVPPGTHLLYYPGSNGGPPQNNIYGMLVVNPKEGEHISDLVIDLSKSTCSVEGDVLGPDNKPMSGGYVSFTYSYNLPWEGGGRAQTHYNSKVDQHGHYKIEHLPVGTWNLEALHPFYQRIQKSEAVTFTTNKQTAIQNLTVRERYEPESTLARVVPENNVLDNSSSCHSWLASPRTEIKYGRLHIVDLMRGIRTISTKDLGLPDNVTTEEIARVAHAGDLYYESPNTLITINGTILAPLNIQKIKHSNKSDEISIRQGLTRSQIIEQVEAARRENPGLDGTRISVKPGQWYIGVRNDHQAFLMDFEFVPDNNISFRFFSIGRLDISARPVEKVVETGKVDGASETNTGAVATSTGGASGTPASNTAIKADSSQKLIYEIVTESDGPQNVSSEKLLRAVRQRLDTVDGVKTTVTMTDDKHIEVLVSAANNWKLLDGVWSYISGVPPVSVDINAKLQKAIKDVNQLLENPDTVEFRIVANTHDHKDLIDKAKKNTDQTELKDDEGNMLAWWLPIKEGEEKSFDDPEIAKRTHKQGKKTVTEVLVVKDDYDISGAYLDHAKVGQDYNKKPCIQFVFNTQGGYLFGMLTGDNLPVEHKDREFFRKLAIILVGEVYSAPRIKTRIYDSGEISGNFTPAEAKRLVAVLNSVILPVKLRNTGKAGSQ